MESPKARAGRMDEDNLGQLLLTDPNEKKRAPDDLVCENKNGVGRVTALSSVVWHLPRSIHSHRFQNFFWVGNRHVTVK